MPRRSREFVYTAIETLTSTCSDPRRVTELSHNARLSAVGPLQCSVKEEGDKQHGRVSAQDIVDYAFKLLGVPFRLWQVGFSIPMWLDDGVGDPSLISFLQNIGVESFDLINFALEDNGLPPGGGTQTFGNYLVNTSNFDPNAPGQAGAIALRPFTSPEFGQRGHIALYMNEHTLIQALPIPGVTDTFTDQETLLWSGDAAFTVYGFLPGVDY